MAEQILGLDSLAGERVGGMGIFKGEKENDWNGQFYKGETQNTYLTRDF